MDIINIKKSAKDNYIFNDYVIVAGSLSKGLNAESLYLCGFPAFALSDGSSLALFVERVVASLRRNYEKDNYIKR